MITSTAPTITATGISAPTFAEVLEFLQSKYQGIFGADAYLGSDSQDGQLLAVFALAISDANAAAVAVYNSFSPATAQGAGLSSAVKINGLTRKSSSKSQALVRIVGVAGTTISAGIVQDAAGNKWDLPAAVVIPTEGEITVTATCRKQGDISAPIGTITGIVTPTLGWQSISNAAAATPGAAVETDAALRRRQALSVAVPSTTILAGLHGALLGLPGVTAADVLENDTNATSADGLPPHSIACIVRGGDATQIAQTIMTRKTPGTYTHGSTSITVYGESGIPSTIRFFPPTPATIKVALTIHTRGGYSSAVADAIKQAVSDYINGLPFGEDILYTRLFGPALLMGTTDAVKFQIATLQSAKGTGALGASDLVLAFSEQPTCSPADVMVTVV